MHSSQSAPSCVNVCAFFLYNQGSLRVPLTPCRSWTRLNIDTAAILVRLPYCLSLPCPRPLFSSLPILFPLFFSSPHLFPFSFIFLPLPSPLLALLHLFFCTPPPPPPSAFDDLSQAHGEYSKGGYGGSAQSQAKSAGSGPGKGTRTTQVYTL